MRIMPEEAGHKIFLSSHGLVIRLKTINTWEKAWPKIQRSKDRGDDSIEARLFRLPQMLYGL